MRIFTRAFQLLCQSAPATAAAFITSRRCIFNSSVIPEFLSDEQSSIELLGGGEKKNSHVWVFIFVLSDTMQFASFLYVPQLGSSMMKHYHERVLKHLLQNMKYFSSTLQRCVVIGEASPTPEFIRDLSTIRTLRELKLACCHSIDTLREVITSFSSSSSHCNLETLSIKTAFHLKEGEIIELCSFSSQQQQQLRLLHTVRNLELQQFFAPHRFVQLFPNLTSLTIGPVIRVRGISTLALDVAAALKNCPNLTHLDLAFVCFSLRENLESIGRLQHLKTLKIRESGSSNCYIDSLQFLQTLSQQHNAALLLTEFELNCCSFQHDSTKFDLKYLVNFVNLEVLTICGCFSLVVDDVLGAMVKYHHELSPSPTTTRESAPFPHLRTLNLDGSVSKDLTSNSIPHLMNLISCGGDGNGGGNGGKLESLNLSYCRGLRNKRGAHDALGFSSLYSCLKQQHANFKHLDLGHCDLSDDDLDGLVELKDTLERLVLWGNESLTNDGLVPKVLMKMENLIYLNLNSVVLVTDFSFIPKMKKLKLLALASFSSVTHQNALMKVFGSDDDDDDSNSRLYLEDESCFLMNGSLRITGIPESFFRKIENEKLK